MGQSTSTRSSRHDNASTRTLHSTSNISNRGSNRPVSFFQRVSDRFSSSHSRRRFARSRNTESTYTSGSSTTPSVRRATLEAARAAAAVTGPPALPSFIMQTPTQSSSGGNSITSATESIWNELISSPAFRESINTDNSSLRYLQVPLSRQQEVYTAAFGVPPRPPPPQSSSASSITAARSMHILVVEYSSPPENDIINTASTSDSLPRNRFLGLRRPRSELSTNSSTDTIQSMPLSAIRNHFRPENGQWRVYAVENQGGAIFSSFVRNDHPSDEEHPNEGDMPGRGYFSTYEDLLRLGNMLGTVRPLTTTQAAVDEAIPVADWSHDFKDESCLVCLDEFELKQPVRILKCQHVFHRECVDRWLCEAQNSCPVCRGVPV
ncbi:hypothetical protein MFLAVUS_010111 [Mucor flavus]|uniref:RING-type E3 ubiquitin transferase n=1 Tax=Mucor flavus TaxID=439312 RepID=A0ABP9ZBT1_9FUNG